MITRGQVHPSTVIAVIDETSDYYGLEFIFYREKDSDGIVILTKLHTDSLEKKFPSEKDKTLEETYIPMALT